jgi:outer membrane protein OmpA-like peptidoglycan-associated protein
MRPLLLCAWLALIGASPPAAAADVDLGVQTPDGKLPPALLVTPKRAVRELHAEIVAGGRTYTFDHANVPEGKQLTLAWARDPKVTAAEVSLHIVYSDGFVDELTVPVEYAYASALAVDLSRASADLKKRTVKVRVSDRIERAEVTAYGAKKVVLDQREVEIGAGPGEIEVPWTGDAKEVVLLDVTLHSAAAYSGFTYSPWFLDVPHEDVLFDTNSDAIPAAEEYKLRHTLAELKDVLDKYGEVVPVKLYIAGCTDTVGDAGHNRDLSQRRARSIARWLRTNGYDRPIYYHGFGEGLLAVPTGDGVDEARNRRVLYMVGANPPPASAGVPSVGWTAL